jgi:hypothetical protein
LLALLTITCTILGAWVYHALLGELLLLLALNVYILAATRYCRVYRAIKMMYIGCALLAFMGLLPLAVLVVALAFTGNPIEGDKLATWIIVLWVAAFLASALCHSLMLVTRITTESMRYGIIAQVGYGVTLAIYLSWGAGRGLVDAPYRGMRLSDIIGFWVPALQLVMCVTWYYYLIRSWMSTTGSDMVICRAPSNRSRRGQ